MFPEPMASLNAPFDAIEQTWQACLRLRAIAFTTESSALAKVPLLVRHGWPARNTKPPEEIVETICDPFGVVVDTYGEFDDRERFAAVIGQKEIMVNSDLSS